MIIPNNVFFRFKKSMEDILESDKVPNNKIESIRSYNDSKYGNNLIFASESDKQIQNKQNLYENGKPNDLQYSAARTSSASETSLVTDGFSASKSAANSMRSRRFQHGDIKYADQSAVGATQRLLQAENITAEQNAAYQRVSVLCDIALFLTAIPYRSKVSPAPRRT